MTTAKITTLTPEQEALLPVVRDEWLAHGLSTAPANRMEAEDGVRMAYRAAGLEPPRFMLWADSPLAGAWAQAVAPGIIEDALRRYGQVRGQVYGQVRGQVYGQVYDQVYGQVDDQVYDQVRDQVYGQVYGQVYDQVDDQVRDQVYGQVRDQVYGQVYDQVRDQVYGQVYGQVYDQVDDQVRDQVYGQVRDQVYGQVDDQVRDQVYGQVYGQVYDQVDGQVRDQVRDQVYGQVRDQVYGQVYDQVGDRLKDSAWTVGLMDYYGWGHVAYSAWFDACKRIGVTGLDAWDGHAKIAKNAGWWWGFRGFAVLTERPVELHRDPQTRLHNESGPAISYRDGFAVHCWHGRRVPADLIEAGWDMARIFTERNAEVRRCAIEKVGWDAFLTDGGLRLVAEADDPGNAPHRIGLYDLPEKLGDLYDAPARILLVTNGSVERDGTRRRFGLPVPATHSDPIAAAADLYGWPRAAYAQLEVRR